MSTVPEISAALRRLPTDEKWSLLHEFADELGSEWDSSDEEAIQRLDDLKSGRVQGLSEEEFWKACGRS